ncbi:MAG: type I DNA topoisomerase [Planctomycetota bacterium]|nr:MAG: type I DNA topoisomerase [Planctomycetota bacterium]REK29851.1 MAG: type I DNA topoisomerase [Planctomycetota bacterium]REK47978.1 MAG: type I DNA topoisomerase [Planctomycetota bacterium]
MAKKSPQKSLVIVESPAKARTIGKYLGRGFTVEASIGHVRDLPQGAKQIPEKYKGEDWAHLGVNVDEDFLPIYIIPPGKSKQVTKLRKLLKESKDLYLATDEDREGEAISWHLQELLKPKVPVHRMVFHEITKEAINEALSNPREIDGDLVRAQEARRIIDRLYGYEVSPLLWRKVRPKLSAGRVQSVAVRLIVERERQRMAFVAATYWDAIATFVKSDQAEFQATLVSVDQRKIPSGKDFDSADGKLKDPNLLHMDEAAAQALVEKLATAEFSVTSLDDKPYTSKPSPPFTTSTLQQEANRKLGFTAKRTMGVAQSLYENGHITYMRTDSTTLAQVAIEAARDLVTSEYGGEFLPDAPRQYASKVKNAQEAHEAIRPAGHPFEKPEVLKSQLSDDEFRLFDLIWKRTVASQMADARGHRVSVIVEGGGAQFQAGGRTIEFPGYLRAYVEGSDDPAAELADRESILPPLVVGESLGGKDIEAKSHTTQPPARFTEASLTRELEQLGIGRPSTYASIIDTILARNYVFKKGSALVPTWTAFAVSQLLKWHLPELVDYQFTAQLEDDLDAISRGEQDSVDYLNEFYHGKRGTGLKQLLKDKIEEIDARQISSIKIGATEDNGGPGEEIVVRVGRYGPYIEQGDRRASVPEHIPPDELNITTAVELLEQAAAADEPLGTCPDTHKPVFLKVGRFGPYIQRGTPDDDEKPKNASLLKGMQPEDIDLETALKLLSLPRELGADPKSGEMVTAYNGRFGPYIKCGEETRSLPAEMSPIEVSLEQALELLAQPKKSRRGFGSAKEPIKVFDDASPVTKEKVQVLDGRYGPYVTDGTTNASLPKGTDPAELSFQEALDLLAARAAKGPAKKKTAKKKTAKKSGGKKKAAAKKKSTTKKSTTKKAAAKKSSTKKAAAKKTSAKKKSTAKKKSS